MTNLERIKTMTASEFVLFLKYCDFTSIMPVITGTRFDSDKDVIKWLDQEESIPITVQYKPKRPLGMFHVYLANDYVRHILADICVHKDNEYCFYKNEEVVARIEKTNVLYMTADSGGYN